MAFSKCTLADGNVVDGITVPKATSLRVSTGNVYTDGFADSDRWVLDMPGDPPVRIDNFNLADARLALDGERKLYEVRDAVLSKDTTLGARLHAAGSHLSYNPRYLRRDHSAVWVITPPQRIDGSQPEAPEAIVQTRDGKVLATATD